tara:strand:+ start:110 stop:865 length:756 start_codon:yes stop_codon:yes gene_type:complete
MGKLDNVLFYFGISLLIICILLTFVFFSPKKITETDDFILRENLTPTQIQELTLDLIEEGDIIAIKPKSFSDSYQYDQKNDDAFGNPFTSIFLYNLFDKLLISSMGDTYWHVGIYIGNGTINSLSLDVRKDKIDETFIEHKYFKVLKVRTSKENKKLAMERAEQHFNYQDVYYSLKNGLLVVYLESIGSKKVYDMRENELVCSGYIASLYREVSFTDKPFTHVSPVALEFSDKTDTKFLVNEEGFFVKKWL